MPEKTGWQGEKREEERDRGREGWGREEGRREGETERHVERSRKNFVHLLIRLVNTVQQDASMMFDKPFR